MPQTQTEATIYPVILSGGSGSRLWPISRAMHPKQFLPLHSDIPMLAETAKRFTGGGFARPTVICNQAHRFMVAQCLSDLSLDVQDIILEPVGRNTAPAVAIAALNVYRHDPEGLILVLPSDHVIAKMDEFIEAVKTAKPVAQSGHLVTFGIQPQYPETGYGYIQGGAPVSDSSKVQAVKAFYEKPDRETAQNYVDSGDFYWNSGMFLFSARQVIDELEKLEADMVSASRQALDKAKTDLDFMRLDDQAFAQMPSSSIDYALMEKTRNAAVMPVDIGWNDLGSWASLWDILDKDANGNAIKGDAVLKDVENSLIHSESGSLATVIGLDNIILVHNDDALLVAAKDRAQDVKHIVEQLKEQKRAEAELHSTVYRPWGSYKTIDSGPGYLVKTISVRPGCSLSLQYHNHRAEHWVVVTGKANVQCGEKEFVLSQNQSTYIPIKTVHRLTNDTDEELHMIEVQSGNYLAEDDIVRLEDLYGRKK